MVIDAGTEDGGHDLGPNPTRTLEAALAACGVMTIKMYARRKKWNVEDVEIRIRRATSEDAHVPHLLEKELRITGELDGAHMLASVRGCLKLPTNARFIGC